MKKGGMELSFTLFSWDLSHEKSKQSGPNEPLKDDTVLSGKKYSLDSGSTFRILHL